MVRMPVHKIGNWLIVDCSQCHAKEILWRKDLVIKMTLCVQYSTGIIRLQHHLGD